MDRTLRWLLLCAAFFVSHSQTVPFSSNASSHVKELNSDDLLGLLDTEVVYLVGFYNATDKAVPEFAATWEAVATEQQGLFAIGAADMAGPMKFMLDVFKVKKLPAVAAFPSRLTSSKSLPMIYKGPMSQSSISKWSVKQLPFQLVAKLTSEPNLKSFKAGSGAPKVCIFHNESEVPPVMRSLSLSFADRLSFAEMKVRAEKTAKLAEKEGVSKFPSLVVYKKDEKVPYEGSLTSVADVETFLAAHALSTEQRDAIRKERKEKREKEELERKEKEAKDKAEKEVKKKAEAAEKKRRRREKRKIVKARDDALRLLEEQWQAEDGEYIQVRETGWDSIPDAFVMSE